MLLSIVYIPLKFSSLPYILLMVTIFLAILATSYHPVLQGRTQMVLLIGVVACCSGMVIIACPSMIPSVVFLIVVPLLLFSCKFIGTNLVL